jgi:hypothetical protein
MREISSLLDEMDYSSSKDAQGYTAYFSPSPVKSGANIFNFEGESDLLVVKSQAKV